MRLSDAVERLARRAPWIARPVVWTIIQVFPYKIAHPHWLILRLKEILGLRASRKMHMQRGLTIRTDPFDGPGMLIWKQGCPEPETIALLERVLKPGMVFVDVGAYVGQFTILASRLVSLGGTVHSFEPTPDVFKQLRRNVLSNRCSNVRCNDLAISDTTGHADLFIYPGSHNQNSLRELVPSASPSIRVKVGTLDDYGPFETLQRIDVIKLDVEGNELPVLRGATHLLHRFAPLLVVEISRHQFTYGYNGSDVALHLRKAGYQLYRLDRDGNGPLGVYCPTGNEISENCTHFNIVAVHMTKLRDLAAAGIVTSDAH